MCQQDNRVADAVRRRCMFLIDRRLQSRVEESYSHEIHEFMKNTFLAYVWDSARDDLSDIIRLRAGIE